MTAVPYRFVAPSDPNSYEQGRLPQLRHRKVMSAPVVWQPFSVYFVQGPGDLTAAEFITDAYGNPTRVGDAVYVYWLTLPGNAGKSVADFVALITTGGVAATGYTHTQAVAATVWTVTHNLGHWPALTLYDAAGNSIIADVQNTSVNALTVTFLTPQTGVVRAI
jgi:hypothetical protein